MQIIGVNGSVLDAIQQTECSDRLFCKHIYSSLEQLQRDIDEWLAWYNQERCNSGKHCYGKIPWQTWQDSLSLAKEKDISRVQMTSDNATTLTS